MDCPLCNVKDAFFENDLFKVILVDESGYIRIITNKHIKEFSELSDEEAFRITKAIKEIEKVMIKLLNPDKVNIASLGNMVPHLHIHIIPRYKDDPAWPGATFCVEKTTDKKAPKNYIEELQKCLKAL
jgi:diadenosine tetraphosphate (Ap4A) HIT family hydrolase